MTERERKPYVTESAEMSPIVELLTKRYGDGILSASLEMQAGSIVRLKLELMPDEGELNAIVETLRYSFPAAHRDSAS